jgi:hypothetical protein
MPPFLPFVGSGKRIAVDLSPVQKLAVSIAFPAFLGRSVIDPKGAAAPAWISEHPEMFPPGSRAAYKRDQRKQLLRRYSGDTHEPLPRSRYFALHGEQSTVDTYTLLGEMNAYGDSVLTGHCAAVPCDPDSITIVFRAFPGEPNPLWCFVTNPDRYSFFANAWNDPRNEISQEAKSLILSETEFKVAIPCERVALEFDRVFDLRYPDARAWMLRFFSHPPRTLDDNDLAHGEWLESLAGEYGFDLSTVKAWRSIVSVTCCRYFGGNALTEVSASFLRRLGAQGLVFPSARCDYGVVFQDGRMLSHWDWNLVDFRDTPIPTRLSMVDTSPLESLRGVNHIAEVQVGPMTGSLLHLGNSLYSRLEGQLFFDHYAALHGGEWRLKHKLSEPITRGPCWYGRTYSSREVKGGGIAECGHCSAKHNFEAIAPLPQCPKCGFAGDLGLFVQRPSFFDAYLEPL